MRRIVEWAKVSVTITRSSLAEALAPAWKLGRVVEGAALEMLLGGFTPTRVRIPQFPPRGHSSVVEQRADNAEVDSSNLSVPIASLAQRIRATAF